MKTTVIAALVLLTGATALVLAARHYDWFTERQPDADAVAAAALCPHDIKAARCPFCDPTLMESLGWCGGHDVPEAICTRCSPSIIPAFKALGDWCAEHGLPESQCALCGGGATPAGSPEAVAAAPVPADEVMRSQRKPASICATAQSTVQLQSPDIARRAGLRVEPLETRTIDETVVCNAAVAFDGDRYAHLASRAGGVISEVRADLGDELDKGDILAVVDSSELGPAKAAFLQAGSLVALWEKNHQREQALLDRNVATEKDVLEAETRLVESRVQRSSAEQRLRNLGLSDEDIAAIGADRDTSSYLPLRAPFAGVVVERHAVPGEVISTSTPLFAIADTRRMWVMLDVYESDVARLRPGQPVRISIDSLTAQTFDGNLTWISSHVDPRTRTIRARAEVDNPDGLLRANMFGRAEITVRTIEDALLVPESAVQWEGCCNVVFVRKTDSVYQPYPVTLGYKHGGFYVVEDGLPAGQPVVTQGSFLLKTEILKGNIGAGCCEVDPGATR
jgi:cobalt-zinc-cadmium efflux system membrane fusion protein